ncbi:MAG: hypothetical protein HY298_24700 [Verrucomicrobia bacterium]|nr:hypothetical protein [Verrucomicrobiota bacterium]
MIPLLTTSMVAQTPLSNLVYAVGTTARDNLNQDWSYVLLDSSAPQILAGKRFAVYGKPGYPADAGTFTLRGDLVQSPDVAAINAKLNQSVALGQNLASLNDALASAVGTNVFGLLRKVPGITSQSLPQKVLTAFQLAATDQSIAEMLALLEHGNPGLTLCAGHAFSEMIGAITTYEIRELDPVSGAAGNVVGRVTLVPNAPVVLPAPGKPFQVVSNHISEHLLIRLRWGTPAELRRLSVLNVGFNLWRIGKTNAEAGNFHNLPPTLAVLHSNPDFVQANRAAVFATMDYHTGSGAGGADDPADRLTFFFADNARGSGSPPFIDGQEFYYFVTARDLLGRDGLVSPGGLARACRRLPPKQPTDVKVVNIVLPGSTNQPRLQVTWTQNTNAADHVTHYWIYRWTNPTMALTNDAAPLTFRVGVVTNLPGTNVNSFTDTGAGAFTDPNITNAWFTVRAVSEAACDPLLSPHSAPAWGVLRQREGPAATTGELLGSCGTPVVMFQNFVTNVIPEDSQTWNFQLTCTRRDRGIAWVQFLITNTISGVSTQVDTVGPTYFPPDEDTAQLDYPVTAGDTYAHTFRIGCTVGTFLEQVSAVANCTLTAPVPPTQQREAVFFAGQLLTTALSSTDPLLTVLNNGNNTFYSATSATVDPSGMVALHFNTGPVPLLVQALTNNTWLDIAVIRPDSNLVYWVSYPACLIGPLPYFRGYTVNLPATDANCDQHVARAADNGPVAPVRVRFKLTERTREYRVYRRAGEGPLTLFAQGPAAYDPANPNKLIESKDEAMPTSPTRLCYFVQTLDEHGNGSPLAFIGCKPVGSLPKPVLAEPQPIGTVNTPQMMLSWFCPTSGVARFQLKVHRVDPPKPGGGINLNDPVLTVYVPYNKQASYLGLNKKHKAARQLYDEAHLTPLVGPGFGPGPKFTLNVNVLPNATYDVSVAAVDSQGKVWDSSENWQFTWTPPVVPVTVPWPARPPPPVNGFDSTSPADTSLPYAPRVQAKVFYDSDFIAPNPRYPVGVRIGELSLTGGPNNNAWTEFNNDYLSYYTGTAENVSQQSADPNAGVFRSRSSARAGQALLPFVLYREQLTNALFPRVSGDITQVSPLIERVPWKVGPNNGQVTIPDRLFAGQEEYYAPKYYFFFYVRDLQPVQRGAKYRYYVVRFNAQREVEETIPAGDVEPPLNNN